MEKLTYKEVREYVKDMFLDGDRKPATVTELHEAIMEGAEKNAEPGLIRRALEALSKAGMLEQTGEDTYRCTKRYSSYYEREFWSSGDRALEVCNRFIRHVGGK